MERFSWGLLALALGCSSAPEASPEDRVATAQRRAGDEVKRLYREANLPNPPAEIYFRAYKREAELELWASAKKGAKMRLVKTWPVAAASGGPGPKRRQGDLQVPEGFYVIDRLNPQSNFWLSLGLNYPNASDKIRSDKKRPGADIFIHGNQVSIGCLAMTDPVIDAIYLMAQPFRTGSRVDIFPARDMGAMMREHEDQKHLVGFWRELKAVDDFAKMKRPPKFRVRKDGAYIPN